MENIRLKDTKGTRPVEYYHNELRLTQSEIKLFYI